MDQEAQQRKKSDASFQIPFGKEGIRLKRRSMTGLSRGMCLAMQK